jgi:hypothetical protein
VGLRGPHARSIKLKPSPWRRYEPVAIPSATSSAAARVRRHRQRQRDGRLIVMVEVDADDLGVLIEAQLLDGRVECFNREAIAKAIRNYLQNRR